MHIVQATIVFREMKCKLRIMELLGLLINVEEVTLFGSMVWICVVYALNLDPKGS